MVKPLTRLIQDFESPVWPPMDDRRTQLDVERQIDELCDQFERSLRAGIHPSVDEFVKRAPVSARGQLAVELLKLAVEYASLRVSRAASMDDVAAPVRPDNIAETEQSSRTQSTLHETANPAAPVHHPARPEIPNYELLELLGSGGMGTVYRARQIDIDRMVAIKILCPDRWQSLSAEQRKRAVERFVVEAYAAAHRDHPNIVTVYERGQTAEAYYLSMQFVDGKSLAEIVRDGPLEGRRAAAYLEPVCRALHAVHSNGILHRDLKPSNILVDRESDRPLVTDFGLAKVLTEGHELTLSGELFGSPPYMSPEQVINASQVSVATDVYGIGATLYHLLTGRPPFQSTNVAGTLHQVLSVEPASPRLINPSIDRDLETICLKCLEKEPRFRYPDALSVASDLQRFLAGQPIKARPLGWSEKALRWCRGHRMVSTLLGLLGALAVFAAITVNVLYTSERTATRTAHEALVARQRQLAQAFVRQAELDTSRGNAAALPWLIASLALNSGDQRIERIRFARTLSSCPALAQLLVHDKQVGPVDLAPDGKRVVTSAEGDVAYIWETTGDGRPVHILPHEAKITALRFSPDGSRVAIGGQNGEVQIWDLSASQLVSSKCNHDRAILAIEFSPSGDALVTTSADGTARVWSTTGTPLSPPLKHSDPVLHAAFAPGGDQIATTSGSRVNLWNLTTGELVAEGADHESPVSAFSLAAGGLKLVSGSRSGVVHYWDADRDTNSTFALPDQRAIVRAGVSRDGTHVVAVSADGLIAWRSVDQPDNPVQTLDIGTGITSADISPEGNFLITACRDKTIRIWEIVHEPTAVAAAMENDVPQIVQFAAGGSFLSLSGRIVRVWQLPAPDPRTDLKLGRVTGAVASPDGSTVVTVHNFNKVHVTRVRAPDGGWPSPKHVGRVILDAEALTASALLTTDVGGLVHVANLASKEVSDFDFSAIKPITVAAIDQASSRIAVAGKNGTVRVLSTSNPATPRDFNCNEMVRWLFFDRASTRLTAVCSDRIVFWGLADGANEPAEVLLAKVVRCTARDEQHQFLLTGCTDGQLFDWDLASGIARRQPVACNDEVARLCIAPGGVLVAIANMSNVVRVWDIDQATPVSPALPHSDSVLDMCFDSTRRLIATASRDRLVRVWDARTGELVCQTSTGDHIPLVCRFANADRDLIVVDDAGGIVSCGMAPDTRSLQSIELDSKLRSGHIVDARGGLTPLSIQQTIEDWRLKSASK